MTKFLRHSTCEISNNTVKVFFYVADIANQSKKSLTALPPAFVKQEATCFIRASLFEHI